MSPFFTAQQELRAKEKQPHGSTWALVRTKCRSWEAISWSGPEILLRKHFNKESVDKD